MSEPYLQIKKNKSKPFKKRQKFSREVETLTGEVQGKPAAEGEERFAKTLRKRNLQFWFNINPTNVPKGKPGWLTLDHLVKTRFGFRAFEIDDLEFIHKGQRKKAEDALKDERRLDGLNRKGYNIRKIEHIDNAKLKTQESSDETGQRLFG